ncbi:glycosyltransferase family 2 protein [Agrobacterium sp. ES01]|uniref:glycosyltransferase family 2 protein n=1 Tax=Agrobacterium sp. ES01 TaxID=3420714 RepID=UPI003D0FC945
MAARECLELSVVAPCYNEEDGLVEFCRRALAAAAAASTDGAYELVLIDDGSSDSTWSLISEQASLHPQIVGIRLMRNHGHQLAASAGLAHARGNRVLLIDADLQDPPELLLLMMPIMDGGADVVYGQRAVRRGETWFKRATASAFYRMLSWLSETDIPKDAGDFRLMSRRVVDVVLSMPERDRFLRGLVSWVGGRQVPVIYERDARFAGDSHYPLRKMLRLALDAVTSFSTKPLRIASWCGVVTAAFAMLLLAYTLWQWISGATVSGWASLMVVLTTFSAVQLLTLGILGEYLGRLVQQTKARPLYLVDEIVCHNEVTTNPRDATEKPNTVQSTRTAGARSADLPRAASK